MNLFWITLWCIGVSIITAAITVAFIDAYYMRRANEEVGEFERRE